MRTTDTLSAQNTSDDSARPIGERSLKLAGWSYTLGDIAMCVAGITRSLPDVRAGKKTMAEVASGTAGGAVSWLVGGLGAAYYGNPKSETQLRIQATKLEQYLKQKGITIPSDAREQSKLLKQRSLWENVELFLYEHPSEILNSMYALGAGMLIREGALEIGKGTKSWRPTALNLKGIEAMSSTFWIGAVVMVGALVGLLVKEDPEARKKNEDKGFIGKAIAFVKEKPLRFSAGAYFVNNGFLALRARQDFIGRNDVFPSQTLKPHYTSTLQLALYLFGNTMLMMSNRDQITKNGFKPAELAELEKAAACVIAAQPPETQKALLADLSNYMAKEKGVTIDASTLASHLADRVGEVTTDRLQSASRDMKWTARTAQRADIAPTL